MMSLSITFDLKDNRQDPAQPPRFVAMTHRFLDFLDARGVKATVFIVGELGRSHPELGKVLLEDAAQVPISGFRAAELLAGAEHRRRCPRPELRAPYDLDPDETFYEATPLVA